MFYALIMAGGSGTRLWPLSKKESPKQTLRLLGDRSMFQLAVDRLHPLFASEQILVVTRAEHVAELSKQVPDLPYENFIVEPEGRGTAPAIGLSAAYLQKRDPGAVMAVLTADHYINDTAGFRASLEAAEKAAMDGYLVTLGIQPSSPSTGYGYIKEANHLQDIGSFRLYEVERFIEKPSEEKAVQMLLEGGYSWNSGMFIWKVDRIMAEFERQMPQLFQQLSIVGNVLDTSDFASTINRVWPKVAKQTIDYGIMEGARSVAVIPVNIGWSDVGSWGSVFRLLPSDEEGNRFVGPHIEIDARNNLVFGNKRLIALIGVEDMVVIDTENAILVTSMAREQDVREIVEQLKKSNQDRWL
jgi:mannose-1-phosphate guanylyltransferase